jgi:hypothetical protein
MYIFDNVPLFCNDSFLFLEQLYSSNQLSFLIPFLIHVVPKIDCWFVSTEENFLIVTERRKLSDI